MPHSHDGAGLRWSSVSRIRAGLRLARSGSVHSAWSVGAHSTEVRVTAAIGSIPSGTWVRRPMRRHDR